MEDRLICPECKFPTMEGEKKCRVCGYVFSGNELVGEQHDWKKQLDNSTLDPFLEQLREQSAYVAPVVPIIPVAPVTPAAPVTPTYVPEKKTDTYTKPQQTNERKPAENGWPDNAFTARRPVRFCTRCGGVVSQNTNFCTKCNTYCPPKTAQKDSFKPDDKQHESHVFGDSPKKNTSAGCVIGGIIIGFFILIVIIMVATSS